MKNYNFFGAKIAKSIFFFNFFITKVSYFVSNLNDDFHEASFEVYYVSVSQKLVILEFSPRFFYKSFGKPFKNLLAPDSEPKDFHKIPPKDFRGFSGQQDFKPTRREGGGLEKLLGRSPNPPSVSATGAQGRCALNLPPPARNSDCHGRGGYTPSEKPCWAGI